MKIMKSGFEAAPDGLQAQIQCRLLQKPGQNPGNPARSAPKVDEQARFQSIFWEIDGSQDRADRAAAFELPGALRVPASRSALTEGRLNFQPRMGGHQGSVCQRCFRRCRPDTRWCRSQIRLTSLSCSTSPPCPGSSAPLHLRFDTSEVTKLLLKAAYLKPVNVEQRCACEFSPCLPSSSLETSLHGRYLP